MTNPYIGYGIQTEVQHTDGTLQTTEQHTDGAPRTKHSPQSNQDEYYE